MIIFFTVDEAGKTIEFFKDCKPYEVYTSLPYHRIHCFNTELVTLNTWTSVADMLELPF